MTNPVREELLHILRPDKNNTADPCLRALVLAVLLAALTAGLFDVGEQRAARYGGVEFTVILSGADAIEAQARAEHLRATIEARALPHPGSPRGRVTISIGAANLRPGEDARALIARCDSALYACKRAGRNCVECAD